MIEVLDPRGQVWELEFDAESGALLEREADLAIRHMRPEQTELVCRKLGEIAQRHALFAHHGSVAQP